MWHSMNTPQSPRPYKAARRGAASMPWARRRFDALTGRYLVLFQKWRQNWRFGMFFCAAVPKVVGAKHVLDSEG